MSNQVNTELLDRVGDLLEDDRLSEEQVQVIKRLVHNMDLEGLYWAMKYIEADIEEKSVRGA